jgi:hypothetical protein
MADDAGFAVALTIREHVINDALLRAFSSNFQLPLAVAVPGGLPDAKVEVFIAPPKATCNADNTLTFTIELWGALSVSVVGVDETGDIAGQLVIRIQPTFVVQGSNLVLSPAAHDVTVTQWDFTVISGGGFSSDADTYLRSSFFRDRLQGLIRAISGGLLPAIDITFLGSTILPALNMTAATRVQQGAMMVGLNIENFMIGSDTITIVGDVDLLADFARNNDIAAVTNAAAVPILLQQVQTKVQEQVSKNGATLQGQLTMSAGTGKFLVSGVASNSSGTARFSFDVIPTLFAFKPGAFFRYIKKPLKVKSRVWPALGFATANPQVDVDPAPWVVIVAAVGTVLTGGVGGVGLLFIIEDMLNSAAAQFSAAITHADPGTPTPRVQHLKPSEPGGAAVRIAMEEYEIATSGTYMGITIRLKGPPGVLIGPIAIPDNLRTAKLSYTVQLPLGIRLDDPKLRVRWTIIDLASGSVLANEDDIAAGRETFVFVPENVGPGLSVLGVGVRVYRALGAQITDFVNDGITLNIRGALPAGAYVRWWYDVKNPQVLFDDKSDSWDYLGEVVVKRHSKYHRTDHPCAMAARTSRYLYEFDILDALPFPVADIAIHRFELCDYCFYGGPAGLRPAL